MTQLHHSLATVLFTDIVGSTERATELRDQGWGELRRSHDALVRRELRRFGGREVKTTGDGFLALFARPAQGVACAATIRGAVRELGLDIRAGLHMGEVEETRKDVAGVVVHVAARVAAAATAGEVLVSSTVRDALGGSHFDFEDRGAHALKGVPGDWRLYAVTSVPALEPETRLVRILGRARHSRPILIGAGAALALFLLAGLYVGLRERNGRQRAGDAQPLAAAPGIAVLPFTVRGAGLDVWREGMMDVLSTNLDGVGGVRAVNSRTVLARWREGAREGTTPDLGTYLDIARRAGARYAVVGDAVSAGPRLRLAANLYDVASGRSLGAEQIEGSPDSVFGLVDRLSIQVLRTIPNIDPGELARVNLARTTTASIPALKAYLEGEQLFRRSDFEGAVAAYRRAVEADSTFALPLWKLGSWLSFAQDVEVASLDRLESLADRLPPREALLLRADVAIRRHETNEGLSLLKEAVQDYPDDPDIWYQLGEMYFHRWGPLLVDPEEADRAFAKTVELDPSFAPAYIHLAGAAFFVHADSARAARLVEAYSRLAPGDEADQLNRIAFGLAFGDSALRSQALSALDTLSVRDLDVIAGDYLSHPRLHAAHQIVFQAILRRAQAIDRGAASAGPDEAAFGYFITSWHGNLARGKLHAALEYISRSELPPGFREYTVYVVFLTGLAELPQSSERALAINAVADSSADIHVHDFFAGAYAADRARWDDYETALAHLRSYAKASAAGEDSVTASALAGYGLWRRGRPAEALPILESAQRLLPPGERNAVVRWWLGTLLLEMERPQEAQRYFSSLAWSELNIPAQYSLARIYEAQGDYERAREAYAYVALAWSEADPELQPVVQEARAAARRLTSVIRE